MKVMLLKVALPTAEKLGHINSMASLLLSDCGWQAVLVATLRKQIYLLENQIPPTTSHATTPCMPTQDGNHGECPKLVADYDSEEAQPVSAPNASSGMQPAMHSDDHPTAAHHARNEAQPYPAMHVKQEPNESGRAQSPLHTHGFLGAVAHGSDEAQPSTAPHLSEAPREAGKGQPPLHTLEHLTAAAYANNEAHQRFPAPDNARGAQPSLLTEDDPPAAHCGRKVAQPSSALYPNEAPEEAGKEQPPLHTAEHLTAADYDNNEAHQPFPAPGGARGRRSPLLTDDGPAAAHSDSRRAQPSPTLNEPAGLECPLFTADHATAAEYGDDYAQPHPALNEAGGMQSPLWSDDHATAGDHDSHESQPIPASNESLGLQPAFLADDGLAAAEYNGHDAQPAPASNESEMQSPLPADEHLTAAGVKHISSMPDELPSAHLQQHREPPRSDIEPGSNCISDPEQRCDQDADLDPAGHDQGAALSRHASPTPDRDYEACWELAAQEVASLLEETSSLPDHIWSPQVSNPFEEPQVSNSPLHIKAF